MEDRVKRSADALSNEVEVVPPPDGWQSRYDDSVASKFGCNGVGVVQSTVINSLMSFLEANQQSVVKSFGLSEYFWFCL